jgi:hypothetical protein
MLIVFRFVRLVYFIKQVNFKARKGKDVIMLVPCRTPYRYRSITRDCTGSAASGRHLNHMSRTENKVTNAWNIALCWTLAIMRWCQK